MLTVEIKLNGEVIAKANVRNVSSLADVSDYQVAWYEDASPDLCIDASEGLFAIKAHRRRQTAWALVAKVVVGILDKLAGDPRGIR
jgi:hypothetical protein